MRPVPLRPLSALTILARHFEIFFYLLSCPGIEKSKKSQKSTFSLIPCKINIVFSRIEKAFIKFDKIREKLVRIFQKFWKNSQTLSTTCILQIWPTEGLYKSYKVKSDVQIHTNFNNLSRVWNSKKNGANFQKNLKKFLKIKHHLYITEISIRSPRKFKSLRNDDCKSTFLKDGDSDP